MRFSDLAFLETTEKAFAFAPRNFQKTALTGICTGKLNFWGKHVLCRRNRNTHTELVL